MPAYTGAGAYSAYGVQTLNWGRAIEVLPGSTYTVFARVRSVMSMKDPSFSIGLEMSNGTTVWAQQNQIVSSTAWVEIQGFVVIPAGVVSAILKIANSEILASFEVDEFKAGDVTLALQMTAQVTAASGSANTATTKATEAAQSATAAAGSATTANTKAAEASTSASQAAQSKTDAAGSASAASNSATLAATARTDAQTAAGNASASASAASTSATNAAASATTSTQQATVSTNKASEASTSAGTASTKASEAAASATDALGSKNAAATSASTSATALSDVQKAMNASRQILNSVPLPYLLGFGGVSAGLPDSYAATAANSSAYGSDTDGAFYQRAAGSTGQAVFARSLVPVDATSAIKISLRLKSTVDMTLRGRIVFVMADGSAVSTVYSDPVVFSAGVAGNISFVLGATSGGIVTKAAGTVANWTNCVGIRVGADNQTSATGEYFKLYSIVVDDVTQADLAARSANTAAGSATAAATSATAASASQTAAGTSATAASNSATTATTQAGNAGTSAAAAATSATDALGSKNAAATSASTAATSATNAGDSATAAANSATTASTKATEAAQSATSAQTSSNTAATKAGEASTSATKAASSATDALGSKNAAATSATTSATALSDAQRALASSPTLISGRASTAVLPYGYGSTGVVESYAVRPATDYASDADGVYLSRSAAGANAAAYLRAMVPAVDGAVYRVTAKIKSTAANSVQLLVYLLNASGASVVQAGKVTTSVEAGAVTTISMILSRSMGGLVTDTIGTLANWNAASFIRFGARTVNAVAASFLQVYDIQVEDLTQANNALVQAGLAAGSATAASTSATAAAASATTADQQATAASTSANTATTKAGEASTKASEAATSASDALGSKNAAAASASVAATSTNISTAAAGGNMVIDPFFLETPTKWNSSLGGAITIVTHGQPEPTTQLAVRSSATDGDAGMYSPYTSVVPGNNRKYRISGKYRTSGNVGNVYVLANTTTTTAGILIGGAQSSFTPFSVVQTNAIGDSDLRFRGYHTGGSGATWLEFTDLVIEDITNASVVESFANAAASSATTASTKASEASASAATATTQANTAITQAGLAQTRATAAATSETNAAGSAQQASNQVSLAALAMSNGISKNPVFKDWTSTYPSNTTFAVANGTVAKRTDGKYGNSVELNVTSTAGAGPYFSVVGGQHTGGANPANVLVTVEAEVLSGDPTGFLVEGLWVDGATIYYASLNIGTKLSKSGIEVYQCVLKRPAGASAATEFRFRCMSSHNTDGSTRGVAKIVIHRFDAQEIKADSYLDQQLTAKASLDGIASTSYLMRLKSGGASAGFEMVSASNPTGSASSIRMSADEIIMDGTVKAPKIAAGEITASKLAIGDTSNIFPDPDMVDASLYISSTSFSLGPNSYGTSKNKLSITPTDGAVDKIVLGPSFSVEENLEYQIAHKVGVEGAGTSGVSSAVLSINWYSDVAATTLIGTLQLRSNSSTSQRTVRQTNIVTAPVGVRRARLEFKRTGHATSIQNSVFNEIVIRRAMSGELIVNGTITSAHVTTGELITGGAQIRDAIITDAHVNNLSAAKLTAGSALAASITVSGRALSAIDADASLGAQNPATRVNAGATTIDPGKIQISGSTSLADWRGSSDTTTINGGKIETDSISSRVLKVGTLQNLVQNGDFSDTSITAPNYWVSTNGSLAWDTTETYLGSPSLRATKTASNSAHDIYTQASKRFNVVPGEVFSISAVVKANAAAAQGLYLRVYWYNAAGSMLTPAYGGSKENQPLTTSWVKHEYQITAPALAATAEVRLINNSNQTTATILYVGQIRAQRATGTVEIADGAITGAKLVTTENLITVAAQIKDAIISEAKISGTISAAKLTAGSALASTITVSGKALSAISSDATLGAQDPTTRINAGSTTIDPGKIVISGATTLADWRGSTDTTTINGGKIETDSVSARSVKVGLMENLVTGGDVDTTIDLSSAFVVQAGTMGYDTTITFQGRPTISTAKNVAGGSCQLWQSANKYFPTIDNEVFSVEVIARALTAMTVGFYVIVDFYQADKTTFISNVTLVNNVALGTSFEAFRGQAKAPIGAAWARIRLINHSTQTSNLELRVGLMKITRTKGSVHIEDGSITADKIVASSVKAYHLATETLITQSAQIGDGVILSANIGAAQITNAKIANGEVDNIKIANGAISNAKIGDLQVDTLKIAGNAVTVFRGARNTAVANSTVNAWTTVAWVGFTPTDGANSLLAMVGAGMTLTSGSSGGGVTAKGNARLLWRGNVVREFTDVMTLVAGGNTLNSPLAMTEILTAGWGYGELIFQISKGSTAGNFTVDASLIAGEFKR